MSNVKRAMVALVWLGMLVFPIYLVLADLPAGFWGFADPDTARSVLMRIIGLVLFTLVTQQILTQEFKPFFNKVMGQFFTKRYHIIVGTFTLLFAFLHPILYYITKLSLGSKFFDVSFGQGYEWPTRYFYFLGPLSLLILVCTAMAGLLRRAPWLQKHWYSIHKLNYLLFITAFFHSWNIGSSLLTSSLLRGLWVTYLVIITYGFIYKFVIAKYRARVNQPITNANPLTTKS